MLNTTPAPAAPGNEPVLRVPPHSIEAEQSVLGGLMLVDAAWDQVADRLTEADFYRREHQLIFRAIGELAAAGVPRDAVTLGEWFERQGKANEVGGAAYLTELANNTPSAANIGAYADIVRDRSVRRQLIEVGTATAGEGFEPGNSTTAELVAAAERGIAVIADARARGSSGPRTACDGMSEYLSWLSERSRLSGPPGLQTGFRELDARIGGFEPGQLIVLAGRPSMGKTALALNMAESILVRDKRPVLFYSLEMSSRDLYSRFTSSLASIALTRLRAPAELRSEEWAKISSTAEKVGVWPLKVDTTAALSPAEMRARARRIKAQCGELGAVFVDYLQLMSVPGTRENRTTEVSEISRNLKIMAKELDVPVIALAQLNRAVEQRTDKRPVMSDLRESGAIEQDADLILFLYRDEVYNRESNAKGIAEVIISKQRNGPTGTVRLAFQGEYTRFENLAPGADGQLSRPVGTPVRKDDTDENW